MSRPAAGSLLPGACPDDPAVVPATTTAGPCAIGGVGGSGTRVVAQVLRDVGFFMGTDLNDANDNLWFTLLFKRPEILTIDDEEFDSWVRLFVDRMSGDLRIDDTVRNQVRSLVGPQRLQHSSKWLQERCDTFLSCDGRRSAPRWGWKEPNTHVVLERLIRSMPDLRYVHTGRNGLDMAFADNQNQSRLWGPVLTGEPYEPTPRYHLRYWCVATRRALRAAAGLEDRFLLIDFDRLCLDPSSEVTRLLSFLGVDHSPDQVRDLAALAVPPPSIGRWRTHGLDIFDASDVDYVAELGFDVGEWTSGGIEQ